MKKINQILIQLLMLSLIISSCQDFLEVEAVGAVGERTLSNEYGLDLAITGMYATFHQTNYFAKTLSNYPYGDVMGGSANKGSTFTDQSDFTNLETYGFTTDNGYLEQKWASVYDGIFRANNMMSIAHDIQEEIKEINGESKDLYTEAIAQGRFFRGFWHFEGVKLFGAAIPYVGDEEFESSVNPAVSNVDESGNYIYIWDKIIEDLQFAFDNLPDTWSSDKGRINKWAAGSMLAKVMAYQSSPYNGKNGSVNKWAEVKTLLETIIENGRDNNGTKYQLAETYETLYTSGESDWTGESVLDIQMAISGTQGNTNTINGGPHIGMSGALGTGGWGFYQPSNDLVNSHIVDADGLPYLDKGYQDFDPLTTMEKGENPKTDLYVYTDPRLDISVGRFNVPYMDWSVPTSTDGWIRDVGNGGLYLNKKNIPKKADKGSLSVSTSTASSAKNFHLIRFADILLLYAEALIEIGNPQGAMDYINKIRARAANGYIRAVDPTTMEGAPSEFVLDDMVNNQEQGNAAANYRIGLYPASQFNTKEGATEALRFERKLELALEGHRWYDLARWGIVANELNNYVDYEKQYLPKFANSVYNADWVTLPIPYNQIITMEGVLVQNENWR